MDLFKEIADMINPVKNAQILNEVQHGQHLYTIKLGFREWETTDNDNAWSFTKSFKGENAEPFKMSSAPYSGSPINSVINVKQ